MKRILFVDDEQEVLDGLERTLRPLRSEWDMMFVSSGEEALTAFQQQPFDVIVSDIQMSWMDGATLLTRVSERWPDTIRIVLSGQVSESLAMRSIRVAHQFVAKPCDLGTLRSVVGRATALRERLNHEGLRRLVGHLGSLPSLPKIHQQLTIAMDDHDVTPRALARIIEQDPALVANILRIVNSAFFGLARNISRIEEGIKYLGMNILKQLTLQVELFHPAPRAASQVQLSIEALQVHSVWTARVAEQLVAGKLQKEAAFAAGLLHEIGTLVVLRSRPEMVSEAISLARQQNRSVVSVEGELWGADHADVGGYILGMWGLPCAVVEGVAHHHNPSRASSSRFDAVGAVHVAECLTTQMDPACLPHCRDLQLDLAYLEATSSIDQVEPWREVARQTIQPQARAT